MELALSHILIKFWFAYFFFTLGANFDIQKSGNPGRDRELINRETFKACLQAGTNNKKKIFKKIDKIAEWIYVYSSNPVLTFPLWANKYGWFENY